MILFLSSVTRFGKRAPKRTDLSYPSTCAEGIEEDGMSAVFFLLSVSTVSSVRDIGTLDLSSVPRIAFCRTLSFLNFSSSANCVSYSLIVFSNESKIVALDSCCEIKSSNLVVSSATASDKELTLVFKLGIFNSSAKSLMSDSNCSTASVNPKRCSINILAPSSPWNFSSCSCKASMFKGMPGFSSLKRFI